MKKLKLLLAAFMVFGLVGCGGDSSIDWPTSGLATKIPKPEKLKGEITYDYDTSFGAKIVDVDKDEYDDYVKQCEEYGYTFDVEKNNTEFSAFNNEGYELKLDYDDEDSEYDIDLNPPKVTGNLEWPKTGLATLIPKIDSEKGNVDIDSESQLLIYAGDLDIDDYNDYVQKCMDKGFTKDYNKTEKMFTAHDKNDNSLTVSWEGFNTVYISIYAADENSESSKNSESNKDEKSTSNNENKNLGVSDDFKKAMDSYEEFFDEYIEFMKKYNSADDPTSMMSDYTDYMKKYADTMKDFEALEDDLTTEEAEYYAEVSARISKKLLDVNL